MVQEADREAEKEEAADAPKQLERPHDWCDENEDSLEAIAK